MNTFLRRNKVNKPILAPIPTPPKVTIKKSMIGFALAAVSVRMVKNTMNITSAVPSFSSDSLSISVRSFLPPPNSLSKETTATGSVAQITAPNIKATYHDQPPNPMPKYCINIVNAPLRHIPTIIPGTAIKKAFQKDFLNVCTSKSKAASKMRVGRKTNNMIL